jgi:hypothetical protein
MLSFTKILGLLLQSNSRTASLRRRGKPRPALEGLEGRVLMCVGGRCNWHPSLIGQNVNPGSLSPTTEVAHLGNLNQNSPIHYGLDNGSQGLTSFGCGCHSPAVPGPR